MMWNIENFFFCILWKLVNIWIFVIFYFFLFRRIIMDKMFIFCFWLDNSLMEMFNRWIICVCVVRVVFFIICFFGNIFLIFWFGFFIVGYFNVICVLVFFIFIFSCILFIFFRDYVIIIFYIISYFVFDWSWCFW